MMKLRIVVWLIALAMAVNASAQEPELKVKPSGRILFDAAYVHAQQQEDKLKGGVGTPDMRIGVGFTYGQWKGKVDMGFAYGKVNIKDVFLQYDLDEQNFLRGGYFIHQYGYQSCISSSFKETMEEPQSNAVFNNDRMMGLMFEHMDDRFLATASVVVETDAMKQTTDVTGNEAVGAMSRSIILSQNQERYSMWVSAVASKAPAMMLMSRKITSSLRSAHAGLLVSPR